MTDQLAECERFFMAHYDDLVVMATHMVAGDVHQAEELVADAFVQALRAWDRIDNPRSWLVAVIARDSIKRGRRLHGRLPKLARIWATERTVAPHDPATLVEQHEDYRSVMRALAGLPGRQRTIAVLCWCEGWSQKDIAARLGVAPSTVAKHLARAQAKMRDTFGMHGQALNSFSDLGKERA
ncbi:RNA polymerase sigma factor [Streptomyces sp. HD]|uniref:RNA polymerase sigma factor n=1 Tax=Streptomyces sp. HD TaxID=3020892 RepID=UPI00232B194F|nr:sigma-70 family RNA polymerase sigma factor [Streptomyces sp. HD]MDC0765495.1 sigma-70 family RNA polymerase sigma factor [Streptomyces sp. HD]